MGTALVAAVLLGAVPAVAAAVGWQWTAPPEPPVVAYESRPAADPSSTGTLASGSFRVHGTEYAWEVVGQSAMTTAAHLFYANVYRAADGDGRAWPTLLRLDAPTGGGIARYGKELPGTREPQVDGDHVTAMLDAAFVTGSASVNATLVVLTYRETGIGALRTGETAVTLEFPIRVSASEP